MDKGRSAVSKIGSCGAKTKHYRILVGLMLTLIVVSALIGFFAIPENSNNQSITKSNANVCSKCPASPFPTEMRQPNNYSFFVLGVGDEFSFITYFEVTELGGGVPYPAHPIECIDGWWYFCYWNESQCWAFTNYTEILFPNRTITDYPIINVMFPIFRFFRTPLIISTGVRIGDSLPNHVFTFTQLNGRTFKAKLRGPVANPHWETPSGKLIIQVPTDTSEGLKGIWFYAENTSENLIESTGIPVCEHGTPVNVTPPTPPPIPLPDTQPPTNSGSSIPGFNTFLILPAFILLFLFIGRKRINPFFSRIQ